MNPTSQKDYLSGITDEDNFGYSLASPGARLGAVLIQGIVTTLPLYFILGDNNDYFSSDVYDFNSTLFQAGYSAVLGAIFYSLWSGNLGHRILGLKVISAVDGSDQKKPLVGALREGLKSIFGILFIPVIWLLWDPKKQNLYDKIVKTLVVINKS